MTTDEWRTKASWDDDDIERLIAEEEESYRQWEEWWDSLTPAQRAREQEMMDAYVQEVEDERRRQEAWLEAKRAANAERARMKLRKDGQPDRRFA
jgi:hypothetical protein